MKNNKIWKMFIIYLKIFFGINFTLIVSINICSFLMKLSFPNDPLVEKTTMQYVIWWISFFSIYVVVIPLVAKITAFALFGRIKKFVENDKVGIK